MNGPLLTVILKNPLKSGQDIGINVTILHEL